MQNFVHPRYRRDIDGLRGIAVLSVLGFHAFPEWVPWGFVGVDVFFVISGFLITTILLDNLAAGHFSFVEFYARRVRRIFPALACVLAASLAAGWWLLLPADYAELGKHVAAGGGFVSNILLFLESGYFDAAAATKPLLHLWSLGIEEQFYLLWPLSLYLAHRLPRLRPLAWIALPAASFGISLYDAFHLPVAAFYLPQDRLWELLAGGLLASHAHSGRKLPGSDRARGVLGAILFATGVALLDDSRAFPGAWALLPVGAAVLWISAPNPHPMARLLASRPLVAVGLVSYPLYLWHWPLLSFYRIVDGAPSANVAALLLVASAVLAWATYRLVERPLRFGMHGRAKAMALAAAMAALVACGYVAWKAAGLPSRFPPAVRVAGGAVQSEEWGVGTCFLDATGEPSAFDRCPDRFGSRTTLLWGDSFAAHLYPGLKRLLGEAAIVRRTEGSCPPLVHIERDGQVNCRPINDRVMQEVRDHRPDTIVVAANWNKGMPVGELGATLDELAAIGIRRVVVVGPSPMWSEHLPRLVLRAFREDPLHRAPWRIDDRSGHYWWDLDRDIERLAQDHHVGYVSPLQALCDASGCLVRVGDGAGDLIMWDTGHFTTQGSLLIGRLVVEQLRQKVPGQ